MRRYPLAALLALLFAVGLVASGVASPPPWAHCKTSPCQTSSSTSSSTSTSTTSTASTTTASTTSSTSSTTTSTAGYPASFYSGPAGAGNLLPPAGTHVWVGEESGNGLTQMASRESYFGRRFKLHAYYSQGRCDNWPSNTADIFAHGYVPLLSWFPTPANADQIIAGAADSCISAFGKSIAAQAGRSFLRMYWEFNGGWYPFSKNSDGTRATAAQEKAMFQHTVDVLRTTGALSKASIVWCPSEGYFNNGDAWNNPTPYPGDSYADWVCSDGYNRFSSTAWCAQRFGPPPTWCPFADVFTHGYDAPTHTPIGFEASFRGRKPYMVGETGSVEDPNVPGRKGQWMLGMRDYVKAYMPGLYALVYFDLNFQSVAWSLDTSTSSMDGFKALMQDPYFGG